jgi:two-component system nitrate/nitrite response regulator NarL
VKVLVVDDHRLFVDVLVPTLQSMGIDVPATAHTAEGAVAAAKRARPDLVLLDLGLPDASGLTTGKQILEECPEAKVVILTALSDLRLVEEAVRLGFHGYLRKDVPLEMFVPSIRATLEGQLVVPHGFGRPNLESGSAEERNALLLLRQLTPREIEILTMLPEGCSTGEIARRTGISVSTVRTHVQRILAKLQVHSRLEAAAFAVRYAPQLGGRERSA